MKPICKVCGQQASVSPRFLAFGLVELDFVQERLCKTCWEWASVVRMGKLFHLLDKFLA